MRIHQLPVLRNQLSDGKGLETGKGVFNRWQGKALVVLAILSLILSVVSIVEPTRASASTVTWQILKGDQRTESIEYLNDGTYGAENYANVIDAMPENFPGFPLTCDNCPAGGKSSNKVFHQYMPQGILKTNSGKPYAAILGGTEGGHYGYRSYWHQDKSGATHWYPALCLDKLHQSYLSKKLKKKIPEGRELNSLKIMNLVPMSSENPSLYDYPAIREKYGFGSREGNISGTTINEYDNNSDALIANAVEAASWHAMDDRFGWWLVDLSNIPEPNDTVLGQRTIPKVTAETPVEYGGKVGDYPQLAPRLVEGNPTIGSTVNVGLMIGPRTDNSEVVDHHGEIIPKDAKEFPTLKDSGRIIGDGVLWTWDNSNVNTTPKPINFTKYWDRNNKGIYASGNLLRLRSENNYWGQQVLAAYDFYRDLVTEFEKNPIPTSQEVTGFDLDFKDFSQRAGENTGTYTISFTVTAKSTKSDASEAQVADISTNLPVSKMVLDGNRVTLSNVSAEELKTAYVDATVEGESFGHATMKSIDDSGDEVDSHQRMLTFKETAMRVNAARRFTFAGEEISVPTLKTTISSGDATATADSAAHLDIRGTAADFVTSKSVPVTDKVSITDFDPDTTYKLFGALKDVTTGEFIASGTTTFKGDQTGATINFKNGQQDPTLEVGHTYVAYEYAFNGDFPKEASIKEGGSLDTAALTAKSFASHADDFDLAQTLVVTPQMKTTVNPQSAAGGSTEVTDTVGLNGIDSAKSYDLVGVLKDVTAEKLIAVGSTPVTSGATSASVPLKDNGADPVLEAGHTYVAYEYLIEREKPDTPVTAPTSAADIDLSSKPFVDAVLVHADDNDKAQTLTTLHTLRTTVATDSDSHTDTTQPLVVDMGTNATKSVQVTDTIAADGLDVASTYPVLGILYDATEGKPVVGATGSITGNKGTVDFGSVELTAGHRYVVHEYAYQPGTTVTVPSDLASVPTDGLVGSHVDNSDAAQTLVAGPMVKTKVAVDGVAAAAGVAAQVQPGAAVEVTDTVSVAGLDAKQQYRLLGALVDVTDAQKPMIVATGSSVSFAGDAGDQKIAFGSVTPEEGHTYVVYEYLYGEGSKFVLPEVGTVFTGGSMPEGWIARHQDNSDQDQIVFAGGRLSTTVKAGDSEASAQGVAEVAGGATVPVMDTVTFEGFSAGSTYDVVGVLVEVGADGATKAVKATGLGSFAGASGTATVDFGEVAVAPGAHYVVHEYAYLRQDEKTPSVTTEDLAGITGPDSEVIAGKRLVARHADNADVAQTVVGLPVIVGTTVTADGVSGAPEAAAAIPYVGDGRVAVEDSVRVDGVAADEMYTVVGLLKDVEAGGFVAVGSTTFAGKALTNGIATVPLMALDGKNPQLEAGHTYVVYEYLYTGAVATPEELVAPKGAIARHENDEDRAQTVVVGAKPELLTQVTAGGASGSVEKQTSAELEKEGDVEVSDTVFYSGLDAGRTYRLQGRLMQVVDRGVALETLREVAVAEDTVTAAEGGEGEWTLRFAKPVAVTAGSTYVVFETATPLDEEGKPVDERAVKHEDAEDKPQLIVVKEPGTTTTTTTPVTPGTTTTTTPVTPGTTTTTTPVTPGTTTTTTPVTPGTTTTTTPVTPGTTTTTTPVTPGTTTTTTPVTPGTTTTTTPVTPGTTTTTTPVVPGATTPSTPGGATPTTPASQDKKSELASTGAKVLWLPVIAFLLVALGITLVIRRRQS